MFFIESERLKLIPLNYTQLLLLSTNRPTLERSLNLNVSAMHIDDYNEAELKAAFKNHWLPNTQMHPDLYQWYTSWEIVLKSSNTSIGSICFGGYPDDFGETTIGYLIDQHQWGHGYATEEALTLINWGFKFSILKTLKADAQLNNPASQRVLLKAGFVPIHKDNTHQHFKLRNASASY
ncbi:GNAT family N-acetyltransferase [Mucilaginibacter terrae]|uniref:GNAT family N-acetyltransferase n=1 Tax=Mucilaginibacter terrae TaxID=1955052 RepID=UPI003626A466